MEGNKNEKVWTFKYIQDEDSFEIRIKKVIAVKSEELHITMENEKNDIWEFSCSQQFLLELDPIFKKFLDLSDIIEIILENGESKSLRIDTIGLGDKADFYFKRSTSNNRDI